MATRSRLTARQTLDRLRRRAVQFARRLWGDDSTDPAEEPGEDDTERLPPASDVDLDAIPDLLADEDRAAVNRAVGWLVTVPELPEGIAEEAVDVCLGRITAESFPIKRLAYRALTAIHDHHPHLIQAGVPTLAAGLGDRYVVVQEACGDLLIQVCTESPRFTSVIYPALLPGAETNREQAMNVLLAIGERHPVVLTAVDPLFRAELAEPTLPRALIVRGLLIRHDREPHLIRHHLSQLVTWLPTTDRALEDTVVAAILTTDSVPDGSDDRIVRSLLSYIASGEREHRGDACHWLADVGAEAAGFEHAATAWQDETPEWERVRVAAAIDEVDPAGASPLLEAVLKSDDRMTDAIGVGGAPN